MLLGPNLDCELRSLNRLGLREESHGALRPLGPDGGRMGGGRQSRCGGEEACPPDLSPGWGHWGGSGPSAGAAGRVGWPRGTQTLVALETRRREADGPGQEVAFSAWRSEGISGLGLAL